MDYSEIICQAIDTIVTERIDNLPYDITKVCTIVDASKAADGQYLVEDEVARYYAYSETTTYRKDQRVYVQVPNGDYRLQKIILGKYTDENSQSWTWVPPLDTMITMKKYDLGVHDIGIHANGIHEDPNMPTRTETLVKHLTGSQISFLGYDRLGVSADFRAWLYPMDTFVGEYGLRILITASNTNITYKEDTNRHLELIFSSKNMYGNPYNFEAYFEQQAVFDISEIQHVEDIKIYFYQDGQFKTPQGDYIPHRNEGPFYELLEPNIFLDNLAFSIGYDKEGFKNDTVVLTTTSGLTYTNKNTEFMEDDSGNIVNEKTVYARWIHWDSELEEFREITEEDLASGNFEIHWYRYDFGKQSADQYSDTYWREVDEKELKGKHFQYTFNPDILLQEEWIKVVGVIYRSDNEGIQYKDSVTSNIMIFKNEFYVPNDASVDKSKGLSIYCEDKSWGNYFIYNQNGKLNDLSKGKTYQRDFSLHFNGEPLNNLIGSLITTYKDIESITWEIPVNDTMLFVPTEYYYSKDMYGKQGEHAADYEFKDGYLKIIRTGSQLIKDKRSDTDFRIDDIQPYTIQEFWTPSWSNNTVFCKVVINQITYEAYEEIKFGKAGTSGTNVTFTIEFDDNMEALGSSSNDSEIGVTAYLYNSAGEEIVLSQEQLNKIKWSWYKGDKLGVKGIGINGSGQSITLRNQGFSDFTRNYHILEARLEDYAVSPSGNGYKQPSDRTQVEDESYGNDVVKEEPVDNLIVDLAAYLPVPVKRNASGREPLKIISGTKSVIYNSYGTPSYSKVPYKLYDWAGQEVQVQRWDIACRAEEVTRESDPPAPTDVYNHHLIQTADGYVFEALNFYLTDVVEKTRTVVLSEDPYYAEEEKYNLHVDNGSNICCVYATVGGQVVWSQPIFVTQNQYDFDMLNNWNGEFYMDEEEGVILATMLGAGRKNPPSPEQGADGYTFSGVLMGDVATGTKYNDVSVEQTGVYGFHYGKMSFGFKDDGTAFIGKSGKGRIQFDGNRGTITSENYKPTIPNLFDDPEFKDEMPAYVYQYDKNGYIQIDNAGKPVTTEKNYENDIPWNGKPGKTGWKEYTPGDGMKIDLAAGTIDAYNFQLSSGRIRMNSVSAPYFQIRNPYKLYPIFKTQDYYYWQSEGDTEKGVRDTATNWLPMRQGQTYWYDEKGELHIDGTPILDEETKQPKYQRDNTTENFVSSKSMQSLIWIGDTDFFLRSANYEIPYRYWKPDANHADGGEYRYKPGAGMRIDLVQGKITSSNFNLTSNTVKMSTSGKPYFSITARSPYALDESENKESEQSDDSVDRSYSEKAWKDAPTILWVGDEEYYLQSALYKEFTGKKDEEGKIEYGRGMKIDLVTGAIKGYDLEIWGWHTQKKLEVNLGDKDKDKDNYGTYLKYKNYEPDGYRVYINSGATRPDKYDDRGNPEDKKNQNYYPLKIGYAWDTLDEPGQDSDKYVDVYGDKHNVERFRVAWDGTLYCTGAYITDAKVRNLQVVENIDVNNGDKGLTRLWGNFYGNFWGGIGSFKEAKTDTLEVGGTDVTDFLKEIAPLRFTLKRIIDNYDGHKHSVVVNENGGGTTSAPIT